MKTIFLRALEADDKAAALCRQLQKWWPALWTFARVEGVEPTNNGAERALRPAVLWRKGSFGADSEAGSRFAERLLTVVASCRQPVSSMFTAGACRTAARAASTTGASAALCACSWRTTAPSDTRTCHRSRSSCRTSRRLKR